MLRVTAIGLLAWNVLLDIHPWCSVAGEGNNRFMCSVVTFGSVLSVLSAAEPSRAELRCVVFSPTLLTLSGVPFCT